MKIVAIDPGNHITGYAVLKNNKLIDAGLLKPYKTGLPNPIRITNICLEVVKLLDEQNPDVIVLEWTTGKVNKGRHKGGGSGLPIYGIAIGAIWMKMLCWCDDCGLDPKTEVVLIDESWTKRVSKKKRLDALELSCPAYHRKDDKGGDMGDAILLAQYYTTRQLLVREDLGK